MSYFDEINAPIEVNLLVASCDIKGFAKECEKFTNHRIFEIMSQFQTICYNIIDNSGGQIIKFMGDGILIIFPGHIANSAVQVLKELQVRIDRFIKAFCPDCLFIVKAHYGLTVCGKIGKDNHKQLDIIGKVVHHTFKMESDGFAISEALEERLKQTGRTPRY